MIIAVDKGMEFAYANQLRLSFAIGDFDSVNQEVLAHYKGEAKVKIDTYPSQKNATDTQLGFEKAIELGSKCIWIIGATGSRIDHFLGNINCLVYPLKAGIQAAIVDANNHISLIKSGTTIRKAEQFGNYVSFLPFGGRVTGITLKGFKYPLDDYTMETDATIGISNEIVADVAEVTLESGILIKIESRD